MLKRTLIAAVFTLATAGTALPAFAQAGLINVTITNVSILNNFLNAAQIAALNNIGVPVTVQAPIGVAANVCDVSVAVLGGAGSGGACTAMSGSQSLAQIVNRQLLHQAR